MSKHRLLLRNNNNGIGGLRRLHRRGLSLSSSSRAQQSQPQRYYGLVASCSSTATAAAAAIAAATTTTGSGTVRRYKSNKSNTNNNTNHNVRNRHRHHSSMLPPLLHFSQDTILRYPRNIKTPGLPTTGSSSSMNTAPIFELKMHVTNRREFNEDAGHATATDNKNNNNNKNEEVSNRRNFCIYPPTMGRPKNRTRTSHEAHRQSRQAYPSGGGGGYAILGPNGAGKTLLGKAVIEEAAAAGYYPGVAPVPVSTSESCYRHATHHKKNPYLHSGQIRLHPDAEKENDTNDTTTTTTTKKKNNNNYDNDEEYRHLHPNHPLRKQTQQSRKNDSDNNNNHHHHHHHDRRRKKEEERAIRIEHVSFESHYELLHERDDEKQQQNANANETTTTTTTNHNNNNHNSTNTNHNTNTNNHNALTVFKAITKKDSRGLTGRLSKSAQFLVIRFGLYPLLGRTITTLSTGELKKVLVVRALATNPHVLILDHAFEGLDRPARNVLCGIISKTIQGFTNDILIQGIHAKHTRSPTTTTTTGVDSYPTQVLLMTHRAEELNAIPEITTAAIIHNNNNSTNSTTTNLSLSSSASWQMIPRRPQRTDADADADNSGDTVNGYSYWSSGEDILYRATTAAAGMKHDNSNSNSNSNSNTTDLPCVEQQKKEKLNTTHDIDWNNPSLPTKEEVQDWYYYHDRKTDEDDNQDDESIHNHNNNNKSKDEDEDNDVLVYVNNLTVRKGGSTLLQDLTWTIRKSERWIVGGGNGAGKSTLSKFLASNQDDDDNCDPKEGNTEGSLKIVPNCTIGWVSTESHMILLQQQQHREDNKHNNMLTIKEYLWRETDDASLDSVILPVLFWLGIIDTPTIPLSTGNSSLAVLDRPIHELSQGEQKLIMIVAAIAKRPQILVLDEPLQGIDVCNRKLVLTVLERICQYTDTVLIYITHHLDEEMIPSTTHAIHLKDRRATFQGPITQYDPVQLR